MIGEVMQRFDYLIIGGGVAGTTAAETLRGFDAAPSIAIVSDEPHEFYSRIALSKENYMLKKLPENSVWLKKASWYEEKRIAFFKGRTATKLEPTQKRISLDNGEELEYGKLLLAVGGTPRRLSFPGSDKRGVYYLRTLNDARSIMEEFESLKEGLLVGGGFITFELANIMAKRGIKPTILLREPYYWANLLDEESGRLIEDVLKRNGVTIIYEDEIARAEGNDHIERIVTNKGRTIETRFVSIGVGITDCMKPFRTATMLCEHGFVANQYLETSIPSVWTAGDCAEYFDVILNERIQLGNWANAMLQGRCAAQNMFGQKTEFKALSAYTTTGLGMTICFVGDIRVTPDKEVIKRGDRASGKYTRIIVRGNKIVGAMQFNMTPELPFISKLITEGRDISPLKEKLADPREDLRALATTA